MKKFLTFIYCISQFFLFSQDKAAPGYIVKQEILYNCQEAEEVFIAWGINGWNKQDKSLLPPGTFEKGGLLTTPMKNNNGVFSAKFNTPANTMLDYVFWITKGPKEIPCDIWDVNVQPQKDYHTLAVNDNIALINSKVQVKPVQPLTILEYTPVLLIFALLLFTAIFLIKRFVFKSKVSFNSIKIITAGCIILLICMFCIRASVAKLSWDIYYNPGEHAGKALWAAYYDYLYALVLFVFFIGLHFALRKFKHGSKIVISFFLVVAFVSLLAALLNIRVVEILGKPFNYRWFYYSGFLNTADSKAALSSNISASYVTQILLVCIAAGFFAVTLIYMYDLFLKKLRYKKILAGLILVANIGFVMKAKASLSEGMPAYERLANPVTAFVESVNPFTADPELFTMEVADSLQYKQKKYSKSNLPAAGSAIKNILLIVLESTPANVVAPYDKQFKATPVIESLLPNALVFDNVYAHAPATNKTMFSVLCSSYPWLSYNSETKEFPDVKLPSLPSVLKKNGYRTAFFNSGDNRFQDAGKFLSARGFETIKDYSTTECGVKFNEKEHADALDGVNDECAADELINWMQKKDTRPFFGMIWTYQTHYPYYGGDEMKNFSAYDSTLNKYLNAVHHSDKVVGKIIEGLKKNNVFDSTLVVIIGDHGEAFGTHQQTTHASKIYEENVHIPCLFVNPAFKATHMSNMGGVVDIAPTIFNFIGMKPNEHWQGTSLFNSNYNERTYFFCPWSDYLFGFREGKMKYIFNASKNSSELYDLEADPLETKNLAGIGSHDIDIYQQRLAAWVQYQDKFIKKVIDK